MGGRAWSRYRAWCRPGMAAGYIHGVCLSTKPDAEVVKGRASRGKLTIFPPASSTAHQYIQAGHQSLAQWGAATQNSSPTHS